ncbi:hypothetical protein CSE45_1471 [Citreicella sp. SE45]|nr:hypothetical protein CSE45_1471 [Citreicella sp. SE45]
MPKDTRQTAVLCRMVMPEHACRLAALGALLGHAVAETEVEFFLGLDIEVHVVGDLAADVVRPVAVQRVGVWIAITSVPFRIRRR